MVRIKNLGQHNVPTISPDGKLHHTLPGDVFPEWATVTNPNVVGDQLEDDQAREARYQAELAELQERHGRTGPATEAGSQPQDSDTSEDTEDSDEAPSDGSPPPRAGRGSSLDAWRDYALEHDVDVDEEWTRDQIIAECEKHGIAV